jgi:ERCC4-type nuclease
MTPVLTIDDREARQHPGIRHELQSASGFGIVTQRIEFGDYRWEGHPDIGAPTVAVELSTVSDVLGKISSDRLPFQLSGMIERYAVPILLIVGPIIPTRDGFVTVHGAPPSISFDRLWSVLFAAQSHGVIVQQCRDKADISNRLIQMVNYYTKDPTYHKYFRPRGLVREAIIPLGAPIEAQVNALMAWPGIGEDRARAALAMYGSVQVVACMPPESLAKIPGWGPRTAQKVHTFLIETFKEKVDG